MLHLEIRGPHSNAHSLALITAGHDATIIVGQHDNRFPVQIRTEDPFARDEKIVAVHQCNHLTFLMIYVTTPHILNWMPSVIGISG